MSFREGWQRFTTGERAWFMACIGGQVLGFFLIDYDLGLAVGVVAIWMNLAMYTLWSADVWRPQRKREES